MKTRNINCDSNSFWDWDRKFLAGSIANSEDSIFFAQFRDIDYLTVVVMRLVPNDWNDTPVIPEGTSAASHIKRWSEQANE